MFRIAILILTLATGLFADLARAQFSQQKWQSSPLSSIDKQYMRDQVAVIDNLAARNFGRHINGAKANDFAVMQRLLDEGIVAAKDKQQLQAMGIILGKLLAAERGLNWIIYIDKYGRSRSLQVPGFKKDFIFPVTQISRLVEVGNTVRVAQIYQQLAESIEDIRKKPPF